METKWFIIFTRPKCEASVVKVLTHKKIDNYCPRKKVIITDKVGKRISEVPLFKSYVFVKVTEGQLVHLKKINGVLSFVYWMNAPVTVHESEIAGIKHFLSEHNNVRIEKVRPGAHNLGEGSKDPLRNSATKIALPSIFCNIVGETDPEVVTSRISLYSIKFLKKPEYTVKSLLMICLKLFTGI